MKTPESKDFDVFRGNQKETMRKTGLKPIKLLMVDHNVILTWSGNEGAR